MKPTVRETLISQFRNALYYLESPSMVDPIYFEIMFTDFELEQESLNLPFEDMSAISKHNNFEITQ